MGVLGADSVTDISSDVVTSSDGHSHTMHYGH